MVYLLNKLINFIIQKLHNVKQENIIQIMIVINVIEVKSV